MKDSSGSIYGLPKKAVCTIGIVLINVIVFLYLSFQGMTESGSFILKHGGLYIPYMQQYGNTTAWLPVCFFILVLHICATTWSSCFSQGGIWNWR